MPHALRRAPLAPAAGDPTYRTVRRILAAGTETTAGTATGAASVATPAHLHGPDGLLAHLAANTGGGGDKVEVVAWAVGQ